MARGVVARSLRGRGRLSGDACDPGSGSGAVMHISRAATQATGRPKTKYEIGTIPAELTTGTTGPTVTSGPGSGLLADA
jgi:hypothetical protein